MGFHRGAGFRWQGTTLRPRFKLWSSKSPHCVHHFLRTPPTCSCSGGAWWRKYTLEEPESESSFAWRGVAGEAQLPLCWAACLRGSFLCPCASQTICRHVLLRRSPDSDGHPRLGREDPSPSPINRLLPKKLCDFGTYLCSPTPEHRHRVLHT